MDALMKRWISILFILMSIASMAMGARASEQVVVDFEQAPITGRWIDSWEEKGVIFTPAHPPVRGKAKAQLMFFPHLGTGRKGILSAMANEPIPVQARFPHGATSVTIVFFGSTGGAARLKAFDNDGELVDEAVMEALPGRTSPDQPLPTFELTVKGAAIDHIQFSGPRVGEYLAADEVRFTPSPSPDDPPPEQSR